MASPFNFTCYVLSVLDERRICVRVDGEYLELLSTKFTSFNNQTTVKDTIVVNVSGADFTIRTDWKDLKDLIGVHLKINAVLKRYSFWKNKDMHEDDIGNNQVHMVSVQCKGVSIIAKRLSNAD